MVTQLITRENAFHVTRPEVNIDVIQHSFDDIPVDPYFAGKYRGRTQSRIQIRDDDSFELMLRKPLYQSRRINSLENYGGVVRHYEDVPETLIESDAFHALVDHWRSLLPFSIERFSVHQIRTTGAGEPVPEGRHRDGYDWIGVYVVNRAHLEANTGRSTIWWGQTDEVLFDEIVMPGFLLTFDDSVLMHDVTAISPTTVTKLAHRDILILSSPEHGEMIETGGKWFLEETV